MWKTAHNIVMYFNYHAKIHKLIKEGHLDHYEIVEKWNKISPALVIFFHNHPPMPVRIEKWENYLPLLERTQNKDRQNDKDKRTQNDDKKNDKNNL